MENPLETNRLPETEDLDAVESTQREYRILLAEDYESGLPTDLILYRWTLRCRYSMVLRRLREYAKSFRLRIFRSSQLPD